jgi:hypothetical protein
MATVTRVNGSATAVGTLYTPNSNLYVIQVKTAVPANVDLRAEDSVGGDAKINGIVENIVKELCPLAWFTPDAANGYIYVVMDKAINDASELQVRIRRIGTTSDITGTVVTAATTLTLS